MKKTFLFIIFILISTQAHAENWIKCVDTTIGSVNYENPVKVQGDCLALGLCSGANNTGIATNVFEATGSEWSDASQSNKKCDRLASPGFRVVNLTAQEIQDIADALASQQDSSLRTGAKNRYDGQTVDGLTLRCFAKAIIDENNRDSSSVNDIMNCIDNASNLSDVKSCVGALSDLPTRTYTDAITAVKTCIDNGDTDQ